MSRQHPADHSPRWRLVTATMFAATAIGLLATPAAAADEDSSTGLRHTNPKIHHPNDGMSWVDEPDSSSD